MISYREIADLRCAVGVSSASLIGATCFLSCHGTSRAAISGLCTTHESEELTPCLELMFQDVRGYIFLRAVRGKIRGLRLRVHYDVTLMRARFAKSSIVAEHADSPLHLEVSPSYRFHLGLRHAGIKRSCVVPLAYSERRRNFFGDIGCSRDWSRLDEVLSQLYDM